MYCLPSYIPAVWVLKKKRHQISTSIIVPTVRKPMESLLVSILAQLVLTYIADSVSLNNRSFFFSLQKDTPKYHVS